MEGVEGYCAWSGGEEESGRGTGEGCDAREGDEVRRNGNGQIRLRTKTDGFGRGVGVERCLGVEVRLEGVEGDGTKLGRGDGAGVGFGGGTGGRIA